MAGEQKRKERAALVTKALLLGYNFEIEGHDLKRGFPWWNLQLPNGDWLQKEGLPKVFPALHLAAIEALKLSGVYDAAKPSGDTGAGSGKNFRLRGRRRQRSCAESFFEGAQSEP